LPVDTDRLRDPEKGSPKREPGFLPGPISGKAHKGRWRAVTIKHPMTGETTVGPAITISLDIENSYELYPTVHTTVTGQELPAPPEPTGDEDADRKAMDTWAYETIYQFTGTGRTHGDSWYIVTVTACSDPALVGREFDFGY
jgi:hypothetical protein